MTDYNTNPELMGTVDDDIKFPSVDNLFVEFPKDPRDMQTWTNEYTGAPYIYNRARNAWLFYIPGSEIGGPPLDPDGGNIWIDQNNMYLMYVYNDNDFSADLDVSAESWVALTSNKRAYDYMAIRQAANADDIVLTIPDHDTPTVNIFGETLMYFNTTDMDLKIRQRVLTSPMDGSPPEEYVNWVSISQRSINPIDNHDQDPDFHNVEPHPALRQLELNINNLQARVDALM